jgi:hypothetical protein
LSWREDAVRKDHQIWVRTVGGEGQARLIYSYLRAAEVLWSPDSKMVAVTDAGGSNVSDVIVFRVYRDREPQELRNVRKQVQGFSARKGVEKSSDGRGTADGCR